MGKSAKAKREKKQDFQKSRLKVGKSKPKPENYTDVGFKAKNINVLHQSLSTSAPSVSSQFTHHLVLLNHKSESQRRESLAYLTSTIQSSQSLPQSAATIIPKVQPLLLDSSASVRAQCVKFLEALPPTDVVDNTPRLLLFARAALTHLRPRVRSTGLDVLEWLLNCAGAQVVTCPAGWTKTLSCLLALLGWQESSIRHGSDGGWTVMQQERSVNSSEDDTKMRIHQIQVLALLLESGLIDSKRKTRRNAEAAAMSCEWPLWQWQQHRLPTKNNPYAYLNLFGELGRASDETCPDFDDRLQVFETSAQNVRKGIDVAKREGGGIGRAAMRLEMVLSSVYTSSSIDQSQRFKHQTYHNTHL